MCVPVVYTLFKMVLLLGKVGIYLLVEVVEVVAPVNVGIGVEVFFLALIVVMILDVVGKVGERLIGGAHGGDGACGNEQLKRGVCGKVVVSIYLETFDQLESLSVGEDVVSSRAWAVGVYKTCWFTVLSTPLLSVGPDVEPCLFLELLREGRYVLRVGVEVAEDEGWSLRVLRFFMQYGLYDSVGLFCNFGVL